MSSIGVIGGSGIYQIPEAKIIDSHFVETPFGVASGLIQEVQFPEGKAFFLARHGEGHLLNPSEVPYRANIYALRKLGVDRILSFSAVGSLKEECPPGSFVLVDQMIDWTKAQRARSFFEKGIVGHVSNANPVNLQLKEILNQACQDLKLNYASEGTYICIEGPQFSTRAESHLYRQLGATVIGMTNVPECFLAKEAGMAYATLAMVTDFDAWKEEHCELEDIMKVIQENTTQAQKVIRKCIELLTQNPFKVVRENDNSIVSNQNNLNPQQRKMLDLFLS